MTKNIFFTAILSLFIFACSSPKEGSMIVEGNIQGMKKGMLYLQKFQDTLLTSVDSIFLNGESNFRLVDNIERPELYYLTFNDLKYGHIDFFGEKGTITINTKLDKFETAAVITGSKSNDLLNEYHDMSKQFSGRQLEIIKENFEARAAEDDEKVVALQKESERLNKNKLRYTASFAIRNKNSEVAPFIVLTELNNAHITLLDTINNSLTKDIQNSKYGLKLNQYIKDIKAFEGE